MPTGVPSQYTIEAVWEGGMRYRGGRAGGPTLTIDGAAEAAPSPVDTMVLALATCSAIDLLDYLEKRRTPATAARVSVSFSRAPAHPRRVTAAEVVFRVASDSPQEHADRAAQLSFEKYCSVAATFAPDTALSWRVELAPAAEGWPVTP